MKYNYFQKKILILGMGLTGISCMNFFLKKGIEPKMIEESKNPINLNKIPKNVQYYLGNLEHPWILESDLIVISPGISSFRTILIRARLLGIEIVSDIELFSREARSPIISITGTNGKSTVATMIQKIAKNAGYHVILAGNIGVPVLDTLNQITNLYILEISSFQLENTFSLKSKVSVILNISEDHTNRYPQGFEQYKKTKLSIYNNSEICIVNLQEQSKEIIKTNKSKKWITFGTKKSDYQVCYAKKKIFLCHLNKIICNVSKTLLTGDHNYNNALVALSIADVMKLPRKKTIQTLTTFSNLPHRFQIIHTQNGIDWINDSKSTNVNSTQAALHSVKNTGTIRLLLGGDSKSANFKKLNKYLQKLKIKIYCFGKDGKHIAETLQTESVHVNTLQQAMMLIQKQVVSGDTVLLSPACSSLDQFSNFKERGEMFIKITKEIHRCT
ncbi:UDP-N-acetylmuramoyl-L-alanine--D-glutamate ligase [Buchnera aphidicola (Hyadaphis tataricae)]|uniref:UDP-N-acetylmuramoylalanine--D-glutamate ligase n=1 Tax=Buchnera aphidicola (Hyadaphis tataricae) TaxID=1241859 RepID=A0A4D6Y598_9GAMM|nr:UDP-N-acetylmuramoyl-L-alanine--D-glutamate ligase [Buchnera aphidicola]QCI21528.1 UDP-N-acetylmuramoyl-L-alanine--D-glutamate ligase [Buchnera aphidicola (Hyadaphis tataricae)]